MVAAVVVALRRATLMRSRASLVWRCPKLAWCVHRFTGSVTHIPLASKLGTMPHLTTLWRGQYHGLTSVFLPTHTVHARVALRPVAPHLVQARRVPPIGARQVQAPALHRAQTVCGPHAQAPLCPV